MAWQCASKPDGGGAGVARPRTTMTTAPHAAERSFGIHNYNERPWGPGGASPG